MVDFTLQFLHPDRELYKDAMHHVMEWDEDHSSLKRRDHAAAAATPQPQPPAGRSSTPPGRRP